MIKLSDNLFNYDLINNINNLNTKKLIKEIDEFLNEDDLLNKLKYLLKMYEAAPKNEIELLYKNDKQGKLKIFSKEFIDNNKNKCTLLINNKKFDLLEYCPIKIKEEFIQVKLIEKLKITDLSHMFENCPLYSIYEKTIWNINNAIDMSYIFIIVFL